MARILLLDDSPLVLSATQQTLEAAGHEVTITDEPSTFLTALKTEEPDLAMVDVSMPTLEGDALVWIARAQQLHRCLIVLYSAKSEAELTKLVGSSGADGFICKTADEELLKRQVADVLTRNPKKPGGAAPG